LKSQYTVGLARGQETGFTQPRVCYNHAMSPKRLFRVLLTALWHLPDTWGVFEATLVVARLALALLAVLGIPVSVARYGVTGGVLVALAPLLLLATLFLVAAYRLQERLDSYTQTKPLDVRASDPRVEESVPPWRGLMVINNNKRPLHGCYGKVRSYVALTPINPGTPLPRPGHKFPWTSHGGHHRIEISLPGYGSSDVLDIAMSPRDDSPVFYTPQDRGFYPGAPIQSSFPLPTGRYKAVIEVGASQEVLEPTIVEVVIDFRGGQLLSTQVSKCVGAEATPQGAAAALNDG